MSRQYLQWQLSASGERAHVCLSSFSSPSLTLSSLLFLSTPIHSFLVDQFVFPHSCAHFLSLQTFSLVYCQVVLFCIFLRGEVILFCVGNALLASTYMLAFQRLEYLFSMSLSYVNARYCLNIRSFFLALVNIILFSLKHKKGLFIFSGKKFLSNVFL